MNYLHKSLQIYKEDGLIVLARKSSNFVMLNTPYFGNHYSALKRLKWEYNKEGVPKSPTSITFQYLTGFLVPQRISKKLAEKKLKKMLNSEETPKDAYNTTQKFTGLGKYSSIKTMQYPGELIEALEKIRKKQPQTFLEIGNARGGTFYVTCRSIDSIQKAISIDLPDLHEDKLTRDKGDLLQNILDTGQNHIRGDSQSQETEDKVKEMLGRDEIDVLFIDGDHSYEGVKKDFELYSPLVSEKGGVVVFDDINHSDGVSRFWEEIKEEYETEEVVEGECSAGFGLIYK